MTNLPTDEITRCIEYAGDDGADTDKAIIQLVALKAENNKDTHRLRWCEMELNHRQNQIDSMNRISQQFADAITGFLEYPANPQFVVELEKALDSFNTKDTL